MTEDRSPNGKMTPVGNDSPFERIRRTNASGAEFWSSREFAQVIGYVDYRNFEQVIQKARLSCFNSGQKVDDHFVDVTEMVDLLRARRAASVRPHPRRNSEDASRPQSRAIDIRVTLLGVAPDCVRRVPSDLTSLT